eukprot:TRINITY_DN73769_c0_g1_i1.p1 TRINITY_DN73769_c0_g1~~TRINITY_DN73769_c0_g1_i1.p1  ORF type:complete len:302 (-),score=59.75 TRINITY_DN73769_c0_g1_i1:228-1055(-)
MEPRSLIGDAAATCPDPPAAFWGACYLFALQACVHWSKAGCVAAHGSRGQMHDQVSGAATGVCALLFLAATSGISCGSYTIGDGAGATQRTIYWLLPVERSVAMVLVLMNLGALARERRPPLVALTAAWLTQTGALALGHLVSPGNQRLWFLLAAVLLLFPLASMLVGSMGSRLRHSQLQVFYRFLASWCVLCAACYCLAFYCCAVAGIFSTETELLVYSLLDYSAIGVSSLVVSCAGSDIDLALLPAQEAELSLYPGPHSHGFYPNPHFYDDNL